MSDLGYALRQVIRHPGLSIIVVLMLAVGLGATTAIYSIFHEILVRPLPVPEPERLVNLGAPGLKPGSTSCTTAGDCSEVFSYPMFRDLAAQQTVLAGLAAHNGFDVNLAYDGSTLPALGLLVSGSYFSTLNLAPTLGRLIGPQDESRAGDSAVVVLSHDYWTSRLGGDERVIGRMLTVNGQALTIIGVAPEGFTGTTLGASPKVFVPLTLRSLMQPNVPRESLEDRRNYWLYLFGRLAPGVSLEEARAELDVIYSGILNGVEAALQTDLSDEDLQRFRERRITVVPGARGQSWVPTGPTPAVLTILLGATALVLLIVCANVASLLLARGAARAGEMAIRASIGADGRRLAFQLLAESGVLAMAGGLLSIPVAHATLRAIVAMAPANSVQAFPTISVGVMALAGVMTLGTALLFGLAPALRAARTDPGAVIKGHVAQSASNRAVARFRGALSTAQIALSTVLLVMAGLFTQSLLNLTRTDLGIDVESVLAFTVSPQLNGYSLERVMEMYREIEEQLGAQPGVEAVGASSVRLLANNVRGAAIDIEGFEPGYPATHTTLNDVGAGFFSALSLPLRAGRPFTEADRIGAPRVAVVNESFVRKFNLGEAAIGTRIGLYGPREIEIVGVVGDAKYNQVRADAPPQLFLPRLQNPFLGTMTFYVRAAAEPESLARTIRQTMARIDPNLPLADLVTLERQVRDNVFLDRLVMALSSSLAVVATLLAAVGLYGVLAYNVVMRTREIGLRLAIGAAPAHVRRMVLGQVTAKALIGGGLGLAAALGLGRASEALLFGVSGLDPVVLTTSIAVLATVVLGAGYLPALRASKVAPMEALRHD